MKLLKKILIFLVVIAILFATQTITFFQFGQKQIINRLLPQEFIGNEFYSDSAFVEDGYWDGMCGNSKFYVTRLLPNLKNNSEELKTKLGVKNIRIEDDNWSYNNWSDTITLKKYKIHYTVNVTTGVFNNLYNLYECTIVENLLLTHNIDKHSKSNYRYRESNYRWFLFFWVKTKNNELKK